MAGCFVRVLLFVGLLFFVSSFMFDAVYSSMAMIEIITGYYLWSKILSQKSKCNLRVYGWGFESCPVLLADLGDLTPVDTKLCRDLNLWVTISQAPNALNQLQALLLTNIGSL